MGDTIEVKNSGTTKVEMIGMDNQKMTISVPDVVKSENKTILSVPDVVKSETKNILSVPDVVKSESKTILSIPDTVKSEARNDLNLDIRPMVTDTCLTLKTAPFPETLIRQPYTFHFGLTLYGTEVMGMDFSGESQVIIENLPKKPSVAWGGEQAGEHPHGHSPGRHTGGESGGLRIRLGP